MLRRAGVLVLTVLAVTHVDAALAGPVTPNPKKIAAATATVSSCGSLGGLGVSWTSTANVVTAVVLSSIPAACTGGILSLTLVDAANASLASIGPVAVTGTSQTFTSLSGSATATSVTGAHVVVTGP
jgi:hypothetical protein